MPWPESIYESPEDGVFQRLRAVHRSYHQTRHEANTPDPPEGFPAVYGIAPDPEWSRLDVRRVILATRPAGAFAQYDITEYAFPMESYAVVDLVDAVYNHPDGLADFEPFRVDVPRHREFFVCTHGSVDICCARYGVPLYRQARAAYPAVRAWRTMHFGGHRYAPTAWEFPSGYKWAFLDEAAAHLVIDRGETQDLERKIRGWSGVPQHVQILDRAGFLSHGWDWLAFERRGEILEQDEESGRWRVRLHFRSPAGRQGTYDATVEVAREFQSVGCGREWGEYDFTVNEYAMESFAES